MACVAAAPGIRGNISSDSYCFVTLRPDGMDGWQAPRRDHRQLPQKVTRLIYDQAADSDPLRKRLAE
jgi:hypothetical protein